MGYLRAGRCAIRVGPFELGEVIGRGGMGEVWSAVHVLQRHGVAIKLLTSDAARDPRYRLAFRNEVRNAALLDHPNLVAVYDYGEVSEAEADASGGRFERATPWLAMERVDGDTLLPYCGCFDWRRVRVVIRGLLAALAHVHARGVYHRDLKPGNVLLAPMGRGFIAKLSDFGLAHAAEATEADHFNGGTPAYMAPEQFDGRWRNYGPWTDLYGLGSLVFALVTGAPPFGVANTFELARQLHQEGTVPALQPPFGVPAGFESWLRRLLEKDPARRYRRAADAAWDFEQLGAPIGSDQPAVQRTRADLDTLRLVTLSTMTDASDLPTEEVRFTVGSAIARPPPLPVDWRPLERARATDGVRAGLNLLGMRALPLVGRQAERDALWSALRRARSRGAVEVVALHGPRGVGKSGLADWLQQRAHEVGSAISMRAVHGPVPAVGDGLGGMAVRFLRCEDLSLEQLRMRVAALVGDDEQEGRALLELLAPGRGDVRFATVDERHFAVEQLLRRATAERPVVIRLDDVHHGADALRFVRRLLERGFARPVVFVLTATDELLRQQVDAAAVWVELLGHRQVQALPIGPLAAPERRQLVEGVLGLEPALAERVAVATGGHPQLVMQLVKDWVERDLLRPGPDGFGFAPGRAPRLDDDHGALWRRRLERSMAPRPIGDGHLLELAAVSGASVERAEWDRAAAALGLTPHDGLVEALLHAGLARGDGRSGWSFVDPAIVDALVARAREGGRLVACHRAMASVLVGPLAEGRDDVAERLGRHLLGAGDSEGALAPLIEGAQRRIALGDHAQARALLQAHDDALVRAGVAERDPRWGQAELLRIDIARREGRTRDALALLERLERRAAASAWVAIDVWCRIHRARQARLRGDLDTVVATLRAALEEARAIDEPELVAQAYANLSDAEAVRGRLEDARRWAQAALEAFRGIDDVRGEARCWQMLGELAREAGDYRQAIDLLRRAREQYDSVGYRWGSASALNSEGDVQRHAGRLDAADAAYRRAAALFRAIGSASSIYPEYNRALTALAQGQVDEARPVVERGMAAFSSAEDGIGLANAHVAMALCSAVTGQWLAWDDHLREGIRMIGKLNAADEDTAWIAQEAGRQAARAGEAPRARAAYQLALDTWVRIGRSERAAAARRALAVLGPSPRR